MKNRKAELPEIPEIDDRALAQMMGIGRTVVGAACVIAPTAAARLWSSEPPDVTGRMAVRGMGARDMALGIGLLAALQHDTPVRGWLEGGVAADAGDLLAALSNWHELSSFRKLLWLAGTVGGVVVGARLASSLD